MAEEDDVANTIMVDPTGVSKGPTQDSCANPNLVLTKINSSSSIPISTTGTVGARQVGRQLEIQSRGGEVLSKETSNLPAPWIDLIGSCK